MQRDQLAGIRRWGQYVDRRTTQCRRFDLIQTHRHLRGNWNRIYLEPSAGRLHSNRAGQGTLGDDQGQTAV